jgi:hypothetical protein
MISVAGKSELSEISIMGWHRRSAVRGTIPFAPRILAVLEKHSISSLPIENWNVVLEANEVPTALDDLGNNLNVKDRCNCCGLNHPEYNRLYDAHVRSTTASDVLSLGVNASRRTSMFSNAIVRCNSHAEVHDLITNSRDNSLKLISLTSSQTSAQRAKSIDAFCGFGGVRGKLHTLMRGLDNSKDPVAQKVMEFGFGEFKRIVSSFVVQKRVLVADKTVDVGIDLHKFCDAVLVPRVMSSAVELQQLTGRLVRICTGKSKQGHVTVNAVLNAGTLDHVFLKHIHEGNMRYICDNIRSGDNRVENEMQQELLSSTSDPILLQYLDLLYKKRRLN